MKPDPPTEPEPTSQVGARNLLVEIGSQQGLDCGLAQRRRWRLFNSDRLALRRGGRTFGGRIGLSNACVAALMRYGQTVIFLAAVSTSSAWPGTFTFDHSRAILPSGPIRAVVRSTPM